MDWFFAQHELAVADGRNNSSSAQCASRPPTPPREEDAQCCAPDSEAGNEVVSESLGSSTRDPVPVNPREEVCGVEPLNAELFNSIGDRSTAESANLSASRTCSDSVLTSDDDRTTDCARLVHNESNDIASEEVSRGFSADSLVPSVDRIQSRTEVKSEALQGGSADKGGRGPRCTPNAPVSLAPTSGDDDGQRRGSRLLSAEPEERLNERNAPQLQQELNRAREAWIGAEAELARSQAEGDTLRNLLAEARTEICKSAHVH